MTSTGTGGISGARRDDRAVALYLDLLKRCLSRFGFDEKYSLIPPSRSNPRLHHRAYRVLHALLAKGGLALARPNTFDPEARREGRDFPADAETMIGLKRLDQLHEAVATVVAEDVAGDLLEAGVWRGGAAIFMRGALAAYGDERRTVWLADSFEGLPPPDPELYPADEGDRMHEASGFAVSVDEVKANFARYWLLDDRVRFLKGWFKDTLPGCDVEQLSVLRVDGDLYSSTMEVLTSLYDKVSPGGFVIVDDYGALETCRAAVDDFRSKHDVDEEIHRIDWTGVYWRKGA